MAAVSELWSLAIANNAGVSSYPTNLVVDRYGAVTLIEVGGITSQTPFNLMFEFFTADNYKQTLVTDIAQITPVEKPNVDMPSSDEISDAINSGDFEHMEAEIGDLLFATIHLAKHLDVDAETALFKCNKRFSERFRLVEILAKISDDRKKLNDFTHEQLLEFWRNAKILLSESSFDNVLENLKKKYDHGNND
jgi:hypothetical protein